jgi:tRNA-uridine 2-sulfurtransferase
MLARLDPRALQRVWFPLGEQTKERTRVEAARAGLRVARRPESQEACFLGGDDYRAFLGRHGLEAREGDVVDESGARLGGHEGFWRFTPGQRRGLGVSAGRPLYAIGTDARTNTVVVGPRESLARRHVFAEGRLFATVTRGDVKLRYRSPAVPTRIVPAAGGFSLDLDRAVYGVAPGQTAVIYEGDVVVGSGVVSGSTA